MTPTQNIDDNKKSNKNMKIKFILFIATLTLIIAYFTLSIIEHYQIKNNGIITEARVLKKSKILGGKPIKYNYYLLVSYKDIEGVSYNDEITVDLMTYRKMERGDQVQVQYSQNNPKNAILSK
jgi:hypothetical protein